MVYSYISGMAVVEKLADLRLETEGWIPNSARWIYEALRKLKCRSASVQAPPVVVDVINGRVALPEWLFSLSAITTLSGDRFVIDRSAICLTGETLAKAQLESIPVSTIVDPNKVVTRQFNNSRNLIAVIGLNYIEINSDDAQVVLYYRKYPSHYVDSLQQEFPVIPDTENTIQAIFFYVLTQILLQGTVHSIYRLKDQNQLYDPMIQWERFRGIAHREINALDDSDLEIISQALTTMFYDKDYFYKGGFRQ